ncbi:hypothetical protein CDAR_206961 [Caerostris darwini]|uniref:Transposase n=1 Tax=Caerostris darwini TaxID=1538125 RepID=A0AAV4SL74_9ARAC|nr:hypothetical protein CDAR_206961 [Caerostris darwini]
MHLCRKFEVVPYKHLESIESDFCAIKQPTARLMYRRDIAEQSVRSKLMGMNHCRVRAPFLKTSYKDIIKLF